MNKSIVRNVGVRRQFEIGEIRHSGKFLKAPIGYASFVKIQATPDETVWSLRASDVYQGGESEPPMLIEMCFFDPTLFFRGL